MVGAELLKTGQLSDAIERVAAIVRNKPNDSTARIFYFELLSLSGDLDRAFKQLEVLGATEELGGGTHFYLGAVQAEKERRTFFHGGARPRILSEPAYAKSYLEAIEHCISGNSSAAASLLEIAAEDKRPLRGKLNGADIEELTDSNDLLGPFVEAVIESHYAWVPWEAIRSLTIPEPRYLRDTIWVPASLKLHSGDCGEILLFSLYVDSHLQADEVKLGRRTVWETNPSGFTVAYGQKVVSAGDNDYAILEVRTLEVEACQLAA